MSRKLVKAYLPIEDKAKLEDVAKNKKRPISSMVGYLITTHPEFVEFKPDIK